DPASLCDAWSRGCEPQAEAGTRYLGQEFRARPRPLSSVGVGIRRLVKEAGVGRPGRRYIGGIVQRRAATKPRSTSGRGKRATGATERANKLYDSLRNLIVRGQLAPGARIVETEVAERFGVSRTPVRAAFQRLEREGYVIAS